MNPQQNFFGCANFRYQHLSRSIAYQLNKRFAFALGGSNKVGASESRHCGATLRRSVTGQLQSFRISAKKSHSMQMMARAARQTAYAGLEIHQAWRSVTYYLNSASAASTRASSGDCPNCDSIRLALIRCSTAGGRFFLIL